MEPAAPAQQEVWLASALEGEAPLYSVSVVLTLEGALNLILLEQALSRLIVRHEILRTTYHPGTHGLQQQVNVVGCVRIALCDLSGLEAEARDELTQTLCRQEARVPFDLHKAPVLRARVIQCAAASFILMFTVHHIAVDGFSMRIFTQDLETIYAAYRRGETADLARPALRYADFARRQKQRAAEKLSLLSREQLRERFQVPPLAFSFERQCPTDGYWAGDSVSLGFSPDLTGKLATFGRQVRATPYVILTAVLWMVLYACTRRTSFVMASDYANRTEPDSESVMGLFASQILLKSEIDAAVSFRGLVRLAQRELQLALTYAECPISGLLPASATRKSLPPFRVKMTSQPQIVTPQLPGLKVVSAGVLSEWAKFDLLFSVHLSDRSAIWNLQYRKAMFVRADMTAMLEDTKQLTSLALERPDSSVAELTRAMAKLTEERNRNTLQALKQELLGTVDVDVPPRAARIPALTECGELAGTPADRIRPWVVRARIPGMSLLHWIAEHQPQIEADLATHRAILFRDFHVLPQEFQEVSIALMGDLMRYVEGATPREKRGATTYTSTLYPRNEEIGLHNELSSAMTFPSRIAFFCVRPAERGGETPLADVHQVYSYVPERTREDFAKRGWMLVRNFRKGFGLSWQKAFETEDRHVVEDYCRNNEIEYAWERDGNLRLEQVRPAIMTHPATGQSVWFNHIAFWHESSLESELRATLLREFGRSGLPFNTYFGDGAEIETETIDGIRSAYGRARMSFIWRRGDLLYLDNIGTAHGRTAYSGSREVLVSMAQPYRRSRA